MSQVSDEETAAWTEVEDKFEKLVRLGTDERTPSHERDNACRAACNMIANDTIVGWHVERSSRLKSILDEVNRQMDRLRRRL